jgi:hypothetical protein
VAAAAAADRSVALDQVEELGPQAGGVPDAQVEVEPDVVGALPAPARREVGGAGG